MIDLIRQLDQRIFYVIWAVQAIILLVLFAGVFSIVLEIGQITSEIQDTSFYKFDK